MLNSLRSDKIKGFLKVIVSCFFRENEKSGTHTFRELSGENPIWGSISPPREGKLQIIVCNTQAIPLKSTEKETAKKNHNKC